MNILMLLSQLEVTGAEVYAAGLSDELIKLGNKVFIISDTFHTKTEAEIYNLPFNKRDVINRIKNINYVIKFVKNNNIQVIHSHSRASSWVGNIAAKICRIPSITSVHGLQHIHFSRKLIKGFGQKIIAVCENIISDLTKELNIKSDKMVLLRNGFDIDQYIIDDKQEIKKVITIIGRLSGPKGEIAFRILNELIKLNIKDYKIRIIGGKSLPAIFLPIQNLFEYLPYQQSIEKFIKESALVIASGRVAIESILMGRPTIAVGESKLIGFVNTNNLEEAFKTNFGDIQRKIDFNWEIFGNEVKKAIEVKTIEREVIDKVRKNFNLKNISKKIFSIYENTLVHFYKNEIPILMYHRLIQDKSEIGKGGTYIIKENFEKQLKYLKENNFETITFRELPKIDRFNKKKKYIILTFDDGYKDNFKILFPLLKKYSFTAVIFLVAGLNDNKWDYDIGLENRLELMSQDEIIEMQNYGIEFGSHTLTHPHLTLLSLEDAKKEIFESKNILERKLKSEIISFAYPYGEYNENIKRTVELAGYKYGIATDNGPMCLSDDFYEIRRIQVFNHTNTFNLSRKVKGNYNFIRTKNNK